MNITFHKGAIFINASNKKFEDEAERALVDEMTNALCENLGLTCFNGCDDDFEYYNHIG